MTTYFDIFSFHIKDPTFQSLQYFIVNCESEVTLWAWWFYLPGPLNCVQICIPYTWVPMKWQDPSIWMKMVYSLHIKVAVSIMNWIVPNRNLAFTWCWSAAITTIDVDKVLSAPSNSWYWFPWSRRRVMMQDSIGTFLHISPGMVHHVKDHITLLAVQGSEFWLGRCLARNRYAPP